jgi:hypothetical protein
MKNPAARFLCGISERTGLTIGSQNVTHSKLDLKIQKLSGLPLFDWRTVVVHKPATRAGRYISSRFPIPPGHADLIAALAGLGASEGR